MVLHFHVSQFLLSSDFPMTLPNPLNYCVVYQDHIGQVGNQERLLKYAYWLVYFAAFSVPGLAFPELEVV